MKNFYLFKCEPRLLPKITRMSTHPTPPAHENTDVGLLKTSDALH